MHNDFDPVDANQARPGKLSKAVRADDIVLIRELLQSSPEHDRQAAMGIAAAQGKLDCLREIWPAASMEVKNYALSLAAMAGNVESLKWFIAKGEPLNYSWAMACAADDGKLAGVQILLPLVENRHMHLVLGVAAKSGSVECVELLLPSCNDNALLVEAVETAVKNLQVACLAALCAKPGLSLETSIALRGAAAMEERACIDLLVPLSDVPATVARLVAEEMEQVDLLAEHMDIELMGKALEAMPGQLPAIQAQWDAHHLMAATPAISAPARRARM